MRSRHRCVVCDEPIFWLAQLCLACRRSYDRARDVDATTMALLSWAAKRARRSQLAKRPGTVAGAERRGRCGWPIGPIGPNGATCDLPAGHDDSCVGNIPKKPNAKAGAKRAVPLR
jgi:hypothetical protein